VWDTVVEPALLPRSGVGPQGPNGPAGPEQPTEADEPGQVGTRALEPQPQQAGHEQGEAAQAEQPQQQPERQGEGGAPTYAERARGVAAYLRTHRARLGAAVAQAHPGLSYEDRENHVRKRARMEYNALPRAAQMDLVVPTLGRHEARGPTGRFAPRQQQPRPANPAAREPAGAELAPAPAPDVAPPTPPAPQTPGARASGDRSASEDEVDSPVFVPGAPGARLGAQDAPGSGRRSWSALAGGGASGRRKRRQRVRAELLRAAGGENADPSEVASVVLYSLTASETEEVWQQLSRARAGQERREAPWTTWASVGHSCAAVLQQEGGRHGQELLCKCLQEAQLPRPFCAETLGIRTGARMWRRVRTAGITKRTQRRSKRGQWCKADIEATRRILEEHSKASSTVVIKRRRLVRKTSTEEAIALSSGGHAGTMMTTAKFLDDSRRQLYLQNRNLFATMGQSTFYRLLHTEFPEFKAGRRKLDVCDKCLAYDKSLCPAMESSLKKWHAALEALDPHYWDKLPGYLKDVPEDAIAQRSPIYLQKLCQYIETRVRFRGTTDPAYPYRLRGQLHELEASICNELRTNWAGIVDKIGLIDCLRMYGLHFTIRDAHNNAHRQHWDSPPDDTICFHIDFKEADTLPIGPAEGGSWWYANARLSVCASFLEHYVSKIQ